MTLKEAFQSAVRGYFYRLISETGGNVSKSCRIAGISRQTFYRYMKRCGISGKEGAYGKDGQFSGRPARFL